MLWLKRILIIAGREYRHHAKSKGFWITMIAVPLLAFAAGYAPQFFQQNKPVRHFAVVDPTGAVAPVIDAAIERDTQRRILRALRDYVAAEVPPEARQRLLPVYLPQAADATDGDTAAFMSSGGLVKAREMLARVLGPDAPAFDAPGARFVRADLPRDLSLPDDPSKAGEALGPLLRGETKLAGGATLFAAIVVPKNYKLLGGAGVPPAYWSVNITDGDLQSLIERALTAEAQREAYAAYGIDLGQVSEIESRRIALGAYSAETGGGGEVSNRDRILSIIPLALALLLWMSIFTVGNLLLAGIIEERSNKLIEVLLSSVTPEEFMAGKLIGIAGIGLTVLAVWMGAGVVILSTSSGPVGEIGREALRIVASGPYLPAFAFYFVTGYLTIASVFLGLGSLANSQQEAQSFLTPLIFVLLAPIMMIVPLLQDPSGPLATALAWIPIYTPFVMMFRLSTNPPWTEVLLTGALAAAFTVLCVLLMARLFRNAILRTGQPPRFVEFLRLMWRREAN